MEAGTNNGEERESVLMFDSGGSRPFISHELHRNHTENSPFLDFISLFLTEHVAATLFRKQLSRQQACSLLWTP